MRPVTALVLTLVLAACGSSGSSGDPRCDATLKKMCVRAAACPTSDSKVRILQAGMIIVADDEPSCEQQLAGSSCAGIDQAACAAQIDSAACTPASGLLAGGFTRPDACNPRMDAGP